MSNDLFSSMLGGAAEQKTKEIKEQEQKAEKAIKELESKELTKEIEIKLEQAKKVHREAQEQKQIIKQVTENVDSDSFTSEIKLDLGVEPRIITKQYKMKEDVAEALDAAYDKYVKVNPKVKKGALVELAICQFLGLDTTAPMERMGIKKK